ncbi:HAD family hydrolase [Providencia alcalifaciens]|uniref:HAD family hydrolase n=1 Tax=Providencia alcalifaciens TaxID=126385 RepID=UPI003D962DCD
MKAVIFDLDNTLFKTDCCLPYLRSNAGREVISELIAKDRIIVEPVYDQIVTFVNKLIHDKRCDVYVFSNSPRDYCLSILKKHQMNINNHNVYGNQNKPTAEDANILVDYDDILVIGDSAKDVYFAHMNFAASILIGDFTKKNIEFYNQWTKPTAIVTDIGSLETYLEKFLAGDFLFIEPELPDYYMTVNSDETKIVDLNLDRIGYAFEYWPNPSDWRTEKQKSVWFDVKRSIKVSKELTIDQLNNKTSVEFYNQDGRIGCGRAFRSIAYAYFLEFKKWLKNNNIKGRLFLVAAPSSVPLECNKSAPMQLLIQWWSTYAYHASSELGCVIYDGSCVERFWPTKPAHMSEGKREVAPHLETLGIYKDSIKFDKPDAVIIIDDVVTSGTQMKAVATLLAATNMYPETTPVYGYSLVKTTRPGSSIDELLRLFSDAEKKGA